MTCSSSSSSPNDQPVTPSDSPSATPPDNSDDTPVSPPVNPPVNPPAPVVPSGSKKLIGYYTNWSQYRTGGGGAYQFFPENINAKLFTHLCYAFATVTAAYEVAPFEWNDAEMYGRFHSVARSQNPNIMTSISIGGWSFNSDAGTKSIFTNMAADSSARATFIRSCINFARTNDFDGIDLVCRVFVC